MNQDHQSAPSGHVKIAGPDASLEEVMDAVAQMHVHQAAPGGEAPSAVHRAEGGENAPLAGGSVRELLDRIAKLELEVAHVRDWYGTRLEILSAWAREHLNEADKLTFFNIAANARPHHSDEPEWFRNVIRRLAVPASSAETPPHPL